VLTRHTASTGWGWSLPYEHDRRAGERWYCIDSYRDLSGEAMITVIIVRNTMSIAIDYGLTLVVSLSQIVLERR